MSREEFRIPRIQLPQIGSAPPAQTPDQEETGAVRKAEDHHAHFLRFLSSGDGLDNLVEAVQRDTVGSDGRTPDQRESEAEQARQESVIRRHAVDAPARTPSRQSFFDDDVPLAPPGDLDLGAAPALEGGPRPAPTNEDASHSTPPANAGPSLRPAPAHHPSPAGPDPDPDPEAEADPEADGISGSDHSGDLDDENDDDHDRQGHGDVDAVTPPGSLWDTTHGGDPDAYDPGTVVVDPAPERAEPGPIARWLHDQLQRRWVPLGVRQKAIAVGVVVALALWGGYAVFSSGAPAAPQPQAAAPIIDTPPASAGPSAGPLPPDSVTAPGCPARSQPPANAFDGKPDTAWVCVRAFDTDLQTITITYSKPVVVTSIFVIPGFEHTDSNGRNEWNEHRVVTHIVWRLGGQPFPQDIDPAAHTGATVQIPNVATQVITGKIFKTVPPPPVEGDNGPSDEDINSTFAMSTITVNGYPAGGAPH